jgi:high-affinity Fe2+/Pb2+ permease
MTHISRLGAVFVGACSVVAGFALAFAVSVNVGAAWILAGVMMVFAVLVTTGEP